MLGDGFRRLAGAAGFTSLANGFVALLQFVQFFVRKLLDIDEIIIRRMMGADKFVQLQVQGFGVSVLRVLDQENYEEGNDGGAGINDELPGIREMEITVRSPPTEPGQPRRRETS